MFNRFHFWQLEILAHHKGRVTCWRALIENTHLNCFEIMQEQDLDRWPSLKFPPLENWKGFLRFSANTPRFTFTIKSGIWPILYEKYTH